MITVFILILIQSLIKSVVFLATRAYCICLSVASTQSHTHRYAVVPSVLLSY